MDRLLRHNQAQRLRAHLLWTVNPLLLWDIVAAGHLDVLAVMAGLLGLLVLGEQPAGGRPGLVRVLAAGALLGVAADIKINYVLFGLGAAWALRRSLLALALAGAAALAVLVPSYAYFGTPAVRALLSRRNQSSADNFYRAFLPHGWHHDLGMIATILVVGVAILALRRLPPGAVTRPAIRPTVALCAAWLFLWPYQLPWYDAMLICVLVLYPASRLDWLVLGRLAAGTISNMPGNPYPPAQSAALAHRPLRGPGANPGGHAGRGGRFRGAVPERALEAQGCSRAGAHGPARTPGSRPGRPIPFPEQAATGPAIRRSHLAGAIAVRRPGPVIWAIRASGGLTTRRGA